MNSKRILVLLTGGTIGSRVSNGVINVDNESPYLLLQKYEERKRGFSCEEEPGDKDETPSDGDDVIFEIRTPLNILSENLCVSDWKVIHDAVDSALSEDFDGIVITHGSDTLAYTAAFLGFTFRNADIPITLIASNYPLDDPRSVGLPNFINAVDFISYGEETGVFVIYENNKKVSEVFLGTRLRPADSFLDQFSSFDGKPYGVMKEGKFVRTEQKTSGIEFGDETREPNLCQMTNSILGNVDVDSKSELIACEEDTKQLIYDLTFTNEVIMLTPYPGFRYDTVAINDRTKAVLINAYHSGTVCTVGQEHSVEALLNRCSEQNVDVYICSYKNLREAQYATASEILGKGVRGMQNISPEAAYVKLLLEYNIISNK